MIVAVSADPSRRRQKSFTNILDELEKQLEQLKSKERELREKLRKKQLSPTKTQQANVEVPTTPPRKNTASNSPKRDPVSPARIRLNIDKGLRAKDVSLRNPEHDLKKSQKLTQTSSDSSSFAKRLFSSAAELKEKEISQRNFESQRVNSFSMASNIGSGKNDDSTIDGPTIIEKYSKLHLRDQYIDSKSLDEQFEDKKIISISQLFAIICPPDFATPSYPNFIVIGIVAKRSEVKVNKMNRKYMMFTLTDLKYDISLALHGEAFDLFWKIREGTVIAVLNPGHYVMGKEPDTPKSIGLTVTSSYDVILELGRSKDLGQCPAITQSGKKCSQWINLRKAKYCEFHLELGVRRAASSRMEFNSVQNRVFSPKKNGQRMQFTKSSITSKTGLIVDPLAPRKDSLFGNEGRLFMSGARTAAAAFFEEEYDQAPKPTSDEATKRLQKKLAVKEMESKIRKQLSERPEGYLLREYDVKGRLIEDTANNSLSTNSDNRLFTPQQIRKIGFDPTKKLNILDQSNRDIHMSKINASEVNLSRPKKKKIKTNISDDDSDDLEII